MLCLRALRFLICSGLFVFGKMCCACRAHGASGDGAKPLGCRDLEDMHEPTGRSNGEAGLWYRRPRKTSHKSAPSFFPVGMY